MKKAKLIIDKISLDLPIVEGTEQEKLDYYLEVCTSMKDWIHEILTQKNLVKDY